MKTTATLAVRVNRANLDHHLWNNNGTWWCHFILHHADHTKQRVRVGLETADASEARGLRDALLRLFGPQTRGRSHKGATRQGKFCETNQRKDEG